MRLARSHLVRHAVECLWFFGGDDEERQTDHER
jgi:hypothetical protein